MDDRMKRRCFVSVMDGQRDADLGGFYLLLLLYSDGRPIWIFSLVANANI